MAKLNTAARKQLPKSDFALPAERKYPIEDKSHAVNAKARATQQVKAGNLTPAAAKTIAKKAEAVIVITKSRKSK